VVVVQVDNLEELQIDQVVLVVGVQEEVNLVVQLLKRMRLVFLVQLLVMQVVMVQVKDQVVVEELEVLVQMLLAVHQVVTVEQEKT
jgi:hypothetical protein